MLFTEECDLGKIRYVGAPVKFSDAECSILLRAPRLGEHSEEVLRELGYSAEDIAEMKGKGAV
jgi:formyl-CoA transferase